MKRKILIFSLLFVVIYNSFSQNQWEWLNPKPSGFTGVDIYFVSQDTGYIVNNEEILITTNCGNQWEKYQEISSSNDIDFKNSTGVIVGNNGYVLKSNNKGISWETIDIGATEDMNSVNIINKDTIIISSSYNIYKTFDGGNNWQTINISNNTYTVNKIFFVNSKVGHAACTSGTIIKTIDGGQNWYVTESIGTIPSDFFTIYFINKDVGFATREHHEILKTIDGGESWVEITNTTDAIYSIYFLDELNGYISGQDGVIFKTSDGGESWEGTFFQKGRIDGTDINALYFVDSNTGFAVGERGRIMKTIDGGESWAAYSPYYFDIKDMTFPSYNVGYCSIGNNLLKTTNEGDDWDSIPTEHSFKEIDFINDSIGYGIEDGYVYKTINGGEVWEVKDIGYVLSYDDLYSLDFINADTGYVSGGSSIKGTLLTTDGGDNWELINSIRFFDIQFLNSEVGYARSANLYKTDDGGDNWKIVFDLDDINDFHFVNENIGYLVGEAGSCYKTVDGGSNWQELDPKYMDYKGVKFYDQKIGYISGESHYQIYFYKTIDGGETWIDENAPNISTSIGLKHISITENQKIFISGANGIILRSSMSDDSTTSIQQLTDLNNLGIMIYPNPTSDYLNISGIKNYPVMIEVKDINGKSIDERIIDNSIFDISYLNKGIYILRISNENHIYITKFVKI